MFGRQLLFYGVEEFQVLGHIILHLISKPKYPLPLRLIQTQSIALERFIFLGSLSRLHTNNRLPRLLIPRLDTGRVLIRIPPLIPREWLQ